MSDAYDPLYLSVQRAIYEAKCEGATPERFVVPHRHKQRWAATRNAFGVPMCEPAVLADPKCDPGTYRVAGVLIEIRETTSGQPELWSSGGLRIPVNMPEEPTNG